VLYVTTFIEGKMNIFLSFDFFLLCPCTTEQGLVYHSLVVSIPQFEKPWSRSILHITIFSCQLRLLTHLWWVGDHIFWIPEWHSTKCI